MRFVKNRTETCRARNAEEARKAREREREKKRKWMEIEIRKEFIMIFHQERPTGTEKNMQLTTERANMEKKKTSNRLKMQSKAMAEISFYSVYSHTFAL